MVGPAELGSEGLRLIGQERGRIEFCQGMASPRGEWASCYNEYHRYDRYML